MTTLSPKRTHLETFQRITGALCVASLCASFGAGLVDSDDRSLLLAGSLILSTLLFTTWMITRSITYRRRLDSLAEILAQMSDAQDPPSDGGKSGSP